MMETPNPDREVQVTADNALHENTPTPAASASSEKPVRRFVGRRRADAAKAGIALENGTNSCDLIGQDPPLKPKNKIFQAIPTEILDNEELNKDLKALPTHYNFEIHKTVRHG
jgi:2-(3-amino-3-carboxypropyl)histidine synthase